MWKGLLDDLFCSSKTFLAEILMCISLFLTFMNPGYATVQGFVQTRTDDLATISFIHLVKIILCLEDRSWKEYELLNSALYLKKMRIHSIIVPLQFLLRQLHYWRSPHAAKCLGHWINENFPVFRGRSVLFADDEEASVPLSVEEALRPGKNTLSLITTRGAIFFVDGNDWPSRNHARV